MSTDAREPLTRADLPMGLPGRCPACGSKVVMTNARHYPQTDRFTPIHRCECRPYMPEDRKDVRLFIGRTTDHLNAAYRWEGR